MLEDMSGHGGVLKSGLPLDPVRGSMGSGANASVRSRLRALAGRAFDLGIAVLALILTLPLMIVAGLAIKLTDPGPVLFRQYREGLGGKPFLIYKFRTLKARTGSGPGFCKVDPGDARVTAVGRVLRRYSIDEIPQLINVVKGEMAVVGPRPHAVGMTVGGRAYRAVVPYYADRLAVRPGLTGWAQVNGLRGPIGTDEVARARIDHDLAYLRNASIALDLRIVAMTLAQLHRGEGT